MVMIFHKDAAISFLRMLEANDVLGAYDKYIASGFRHHNPYFRGDAESLKAGMLDNAAKYPLKSLEILHIFEEGDFVSIHSKAVLKPGDRIFATVHIFRFKDNKIAELWDMAMEEPENSPNEIGMF